MAKFLWRDACGGEHSRSRIDSSSSERFSLRAVRLRTEANMAPDLNWELRLGFLVHDVSRLRRRVVDRALKPLGVTRSQWWVLAFLSRSDGMSQVALADELDLGKVALGQLIDRLEKTGFCPVGPMERTVASSAYFSPSGATRHRAHSGQRQRHRKGNSRKDRRSGPQGDRTCAAWHEGKSAHDDWDAEDLEDSDAA